MVVDLNIFKYALRMNFARDDEREEGLMWLKGGRLLCLSLQMDNSQYKRDVFSLVIIRLVRTI